MTVETVRPTYYIESDNGDVVARYGYDNLCVDLSISKRWHLRTTVKVRPKWYSLWKRKAVDVSTVFLGIDHNWAGGRPVLWETKVFGLQREYQWSYRSRESAAAGHAYVVRQLRSADFGALDRLSGVDPVEVEIES